MPGEVEALSILLSNPDGWGGDATSGAARRPLNSSRAFHRGQPAEGFQRFSSQGVGRHHLDGEKRCPQETSPLYNAEERVARAVGRVVGGTI